MSGEYGKRLARSPARSMGERPQPQLFLADLPESGQSVGFGDQEEDDQPAEHDKLQVRRDRRGKRPMDCSLQQFVGPMHRNAQQNRQQRNERRPQKRAQDTAQPSDDDHEEDAKRQVERERLGLDRAQVRVCV